MAATQPMTPPQAARGAQAQADSQRLEVRLIQMGRRALGLDDHTYRQLLARLCSGQTSSTTLSAAQRQAVLVHMKSAGFVVRPKAGSAAAAEQGWQRAPQLRKLRAMWYTLADAGAVDRPADMAACNAAIESWAKRQLNTDPLRPQLQAMRFATGVQMDKLVESAKRWLVRLGLPTA